MFTPNQYPTHERAIMMDLDAHEWNARMNGLMAQDARIIAFRGAGAVNGIDPVAAEAAAALVIDYVSRAAEGGDTVALIFDGDEDKPARPDIGSVFGRTADVFRDQPNVVTLAAQTRSWYYPRTEGGVLESAAGTPYETFVFPDELPGSHASLTQSKALAVYAGYEQLVVGPAGRIITLSQLQDLSTKSIGRAQEAGLIRLTVVQTPNNAALSEELEERFASAADEQLRAGIAAKIAQRQTQPYGALFTLEGKFAVDSHQYPGLAFEVFAVGVK